MQPSLCYGGTLVLLSKSYTTIDIQETTALCRALFCAAARPRQTQSLRALVGESERGGWRMAVLAGCSPSPEHTIHWDLQYQLYTVSVRVGNPERGHSRSLT